MVAVRGKRAGQREAEIGGVMGSAIIAFVLTIYLPDLIEAIREVAAAIRGDAPESDDDE